MARLSASLGLIAAAFAVLADPERHPVGDRVVLTTVVAGAALLHLRDRRLVVAALAFAVATWATGAVPPRWASGWLWGLAAWRVPAPDDRAPADFIERAARVAGTARFEEECRLYGFAALNLAAFLAMLAASPLLRRYGGRGAEEPVRPARLLRRREGGVGSDQFIAQPPGPQPGLPQPPKAERPGAEAGV